MCSNSEGDMLCRKDRQEIYGAWLNTCHGLVLNVFAASYKSPGILLCGIEVQTELIGCKIVATPTSRLPLRSLGDAETLFGHLKSQSPLVEEISRCQSSQATHNT